MRVRLLRQIEELQRRLELATDRLDDKDRSLAKAAKVCLDYARKCQGLEQQVKNLEMTLTTEKVTLGENVKDKARKIWPSGAKRRKVPLKRAGRG